MQENLLQLNHISKNYGSTKVLNDLCLSVPQGHFISILGNSGSGKSTLLKLIAGHELPDAGHIFYKGSNITHLPPQSRNLHTVFQNYALFPHLTIYENVAFPLKANRLPDIDSTVEETLNLVGMNHLTSRYPHTLSGGQQQRVAIARALATKPQLLLLDESLSALDAHLKKKMHIELKQLQRKLGITFIFVTHSQEEALAMSDWIVILNNGQIEQQGTPRNIYESPNNLSVATFIGDANIFDVLASEIKHDACVFNIEGVALKSKNLLNLQPGDKAHYMVRPEDIRVWRQEEVKDTTNMIQGIIEEIIYKGSTVDLLVRMPSHKILFATEFFDEDDEDLLYTKGETVWVHWLEGWEHVLPYEK